MDVNSFRDQLTTEGYTEVVMIEREPNGFVDTHAHPPETKALVTAGEIWITTSGQERCYQAGDIFQLKANEKHTERYGRDGVQYLVGRRPIS